jgi:hypothetical protein
VIIDSQVHLRKADTAETPNVEFYRDCLNHINIALDFLSADDRNWSLGDTAAKALNWK